MSAVEQRTVTTIRHEYILRLPACWADVKEAMAFAARDREAKGLTNSYDDVIKVTADDDHIITYWEEEA